MMQMVEKKLHGFAILFGLLLLVSCGKETMEDSEANNCDLHDVTGSWNFILNEDPSTEYVGQIDKFNDSTLNVTYQPSTEYNYFLQTIVNCEDGTIDQVLPAGNHGTTTIVGTISTTDFEYTRTTVSNYTGVEEVTVTHIEGTKL